MTRSTKVASDPLHAKHIHPSPCLVYVCRGEDWHSPQAAMMAKVGEDGVHNYHYIACSLSMLPIFILPKKNMSHLPPPEIS
ncbi:hypothetical protein E2P81_ATG05199 [Venturia nashicola]|nr:hypothetical protein E2P81_ATG05199 [Venturia nashicola]